MRLLSFFVSCARSRERSACLLGLPLREDDLTTGRWSMPSLCWAGRLDIISRLIATMADWKINDITNTAPLW